MIGSLFVVNYGPLMKHLRARPVGRIYSMVVHDYTTRRDISDQVSGYSLSRS